MADDEGTTTDSTTDTTVSTQQVALSTIDNPWNPLDHFDEWYAYDLAHGYGTLSLLGRVLVTSNELSEADQHLAYVSAIDELVSDNFPGNLIKVTSNDGDSSKG